MNYFYIVSRSGISELELNVAKTTYRGVPLPGGYSLRPQVQARSLRSENHEREHLETVTQKFRRSPETGDRADNHSILTL